MKIERTACTHEALWPSPRSLTCCHHPPTRPQVTRPMRKSFTATPHTILGYILEAEEGGWGRVRGCAGVGACVCGCGCACVRARQPAKHLDTYPHTHTHIHTRACAHTHTHTHTHTRTHTRTGGGSTLCAVLRGYAQVGVCVGGGEHHATPHHSTPATPPHTTPRPSWQRRESLGCDARTYTRMHTRVRVRAHTHIHTSHSKHPAPFH